VTHPLFLLLVVVVVAIYIYMCVCVFCVVLVGEKMLDTNVCVLQFHFLPHHIPSLHVGSWVGKWVCGWVVFYYTLFDFFPTFWQSQFIVVSGVFVVLWRRDFGTHDSFNSLVILSSSAHVSTLSINFCFFTRLLLDFSRVVVVVSIKLLINYY